MGRYEKKKKNKPVALIIGIILVIAVVAVLLAVILPKASGDVTITSTTTAAEAVQGAENAAASPAGDPVKFPLTLSEGKLELESLFQFDGVNVDAGNQEGKKIAAITLKNVSDAHLGQADINLALSDGNALVFHVSELPAGKSVIALAADNQSLADDVYAVDAQCSASFEEGAAISDAVTVNVTGMVITLTNNTDEVLSQVDVYCHNVLGTEYFGGITYQYTVNDLPAAGTTTVQAADCILGMAEAVRVSVSQK